MKCFKIILKFEFQNHFFDDVPSLMSKNAKFNETKPSKIIQTTFKTNDSFLTNCLYFASSPNGFFIFIEGQDESNQKKLYSFPAEVSNSSITLNSLFSILFQNS
jgi:hypothetical protein